MLSGNLSHLSMKQTVVGKVFAQRHPATAKLIKWHLFPVARMLLASTGHARPDPMSTVYKDQYQTLK